SSAIPNSFHLPLSGRPAALSPFPTRRSSDLSVVLLGATLVLMTVQFVQATGGHLPQHVPAQLPAGVLGLDGWADRLIVLSTCLRSEEHTSELQSRGHLVCRLLLEKKRDDAVD